MTNTFNIPLSLAESHEIFFFPKESKKMLIISDIHCPYHDVEALNICFEYAKKQHIDSILLNGDTFDFYRLSKFMQDPRKIDLKEELEIGQCFLDTIQKTFSKCKIYFKVGNHEVRLETYLKSKAPELWGLPSFNMEEFLKLRERGIVTIDSNTIMKYGDLSIIHGHELKISSGGVNPARNLFMKYNQDCACSHLHVTSDYTKKDGLGRFINTHVIGCLCSMDVEYCVINQWNHGFAIVEKDINGKYDFCNYKIIDGKVKK